MKLEITNKIRDLVDSFSDLYREQLAISNTNASGNLSMFKTHIKIHNNHFEVSFKLPKQWEYVEYGTKPHFPPIKAIEEWVRIKPVIPDARSGQIPDTKQLAFFIARSISKKGTKGKHLLEKSLQKSDPIVEMIKEELTEQIKQKIYDKYFK